MKKHIHSSTLRQITAQTDAFKMSLLVNNLDNINYSSLSRSRLNTHKGDFGTVAIIGGNCGMNGAMYLAGRAAMYCGAGKVVQAFLDRNASPDLLMPELLTAKPKDVIKQIEDYSVVIVGPGLGQDENAHKVMEKILDLQPNTKFIFDADALNLIAANPTWHYQFRALPGKIITPHPREAARLLGRPLSQIQEGRVESIKKLSEYYNSVTVLKGYASLLYDGKELYINPTGNPGLSNAGQGDTLCGIIAAYVAQGMSLFDSLRLGVLIHGHAADELSDQFPGLIGILAGDIGKKACQITNLLFLEKK